MLSCVHARLSRGWALTLHYVTGACHAYVGKETPMLSYMNIHGLLEELRDAADRSDKQGPRVRSLVPSP